MDRRAWKFVFFSSKKERKLIYVNSDGKVLLGNPREDNRAEENRHVDHDGDVKELPLTLLLQILFINTEHLPKHQADEEDDGKNKDMCNHLYRHVPEAPQAAQPLVLNLLVLGQQQVLQLAINISVLRFSRFLMRQSEVPSAEDLVAIKVRCVVNSFNERRPIRAQQAYGYDDE